MPDAAWLLDWASCREVDTWDQMQLPIPQADSKVKTAAVERRDGRQKPQRRFRDTQQHIQADCLPGSCSVLQRTALLQTNTGQFSHHSSCYSTEPEINTSWLKPCFATPELCIYLAAALPEDGEDQRGVQLSLEDSFSFVFSSFQEHFFCFQ